MILIWALDLWGCTFIQQPLTESPRTEQLSLWTCFRQLGEPWDSSLGSPSSVEWRWSILHPRSSSKYSEIDSTKTNKASCLEMKKNLGLFVFMLFYPTLNVSNWILIYGPDISSSGWGPVSHVAGVRGLVPVNIWQYLKAQRIRCL